MVDLTITLKSPHELLKNHGAISEYAKSGQNSTEILILCPGYNGRVKQSSHATELLIWDNFSTLPLHINHNIFL
jgi:hypothetical protein